MATDLASFLQAADLGAYQPQLEELGVVAPVDIADVEDQVGGRTQTSLPSPAPTPRSPRSLRVYARKRTLRHIASQSHLHSIDAGSHFSPGLQTFLCRGSHRTRRPLARRTLLKWA
jgi:hypothetical protein